MTTPPDGVEVAMMTQEQVDKAFTVFTQYLQLEKYKPIEGVVLLAMCLEKAKAKLGLTELHILKGCGKPDCPDCGKLMNNDPNAEMN